MMFDFSQSRQELSWVKMENTTYWMEEKYGIVLES